MHIIGCNFVVTLVGFGTKRNNKCKLKWSAHATTLGASNTTYLHKANSQRKADAQVMTMRPFCRKNRIRNKEENAERQDCHTQPTRSLRLCGDVYRESIALEKKKKLERTANRDLYLPSPYIQSANGQGIQQEIVPSSKGSFAQYRPEVTDESQISPPQPITIQQPMIQEATGTYIHR